jgi:hypothetical protein
MPMVMVGSSWMSRYVTVPLHDASPAQVNTCTAAAAAVMVLASASGTDKQHLALQHRGLGCCCNQQCTLHQTTATLTPSYWHAALPHAAACKPAGSCSASSCYTRSSNNGTATSLCAALLQLRCVTLCCAAGARCQLAGPECVTVKHCFCFDSCCSCCTLRTCCPAVAA